MKIKLVNGNTYNADMVTDYNITMTVPLADIPVILGDLSEDNMKKIELLDDTGETCGEYSNKALDHAEVNTKGELVLFMYDTVLPSETTLSILSGGATQMTVSETIKMREMIEKASVSLDDRDASVAPMLFGKYKNDGSLLEVGSRINWNGVVKRAAVDLWQTPENNPDKNPDLWEDIQYKDGYRIIPDVITAGLAFAYGEIGWWKGVLYRSIRSDANPHTPEQAPNMWELYVE